MFEAWKKPTDWGAMSMDDLVASIEESREADKKLRAKKKKIDKACDSLGKADKGLKFTQKIGLFDRLSAMLRSQSVGETENEETAE